MSAYYRQVFSTFETLLYAQFTLYFDQLLAHRLKEVMSLVSSELSLGRDQFDSGLEICILSTERDF